MMKIISLAMLSALAISARTLVVPLQNPEDCAAGMHVDFQIGGIKNIGLVAGHANHCTRNDRILMRFDLGGLYLPNQKPTIQKATLKLHLWYIVKKDNQDRALSLFGMDFDPIAFKVADLAKTNVAPCGTASTATLKNHPPQGDDGLIQFDVTSYIDSCLQKNYGYATFRLHDEAGDKVNDNRQAWCTIIQGFYAGHKHCYPTLIIEYK